LVEADSQLAEDLRNRIKDVKQAQVQCVVIAANQRQATLYRYNLPEVNSLYPASGLIDLFPGLRLVEQEQVKTISPVTLLQPLQLQAEKENRLVIDLPGEELPVLQALQQSQQLYLFNQVCLYCGRASLYEGSEPAKRILEWLREIGFELVSEDDSRDPDRPFWNFRRSALQMHNRDLERKLNQALLKNKQMSQDRNVQSELVREQEAKINELTQQADKLKTQLEQKAKEKETQAQLVTNLNIQLRERDQARAGAEKLATVSKSQLEETINAHDEQVKLVFELNAQTQDLTQDLDIHNKLGAE
jgi:hypothetical protein